MPPLPDDANQALEEFRVYLETLKFIQIDPRLRSKFGLSDIIQNTLFEAFQDLDRIRALDAAGRKRWLRRMLMNNLLQEIARWRAGQRDFRLEEQLQAAVRSASRRANSMSSART
jgi:hypothetical protein